MAIQLLINPRTKEIAGELYPEKEIRIYDDWILNTIKTSGITVSEKFKNQYKTGWRVYLDDDKAIFAKAFEQFFFEGLAHAGFVWREKTEFDEMTPKAIAKKLVRDHFENRNNIPET